MTEHRTINNLLLGFLGRVRRRGVVDLFFCYPVYIYADILLKRYLRKHDENEVAIVLHLYHTDMWQEIHSRLNDAGMADEQIFISIPFAKRKFKKCISASCANACVVVVPNRGRDVLPFMQITKHIVRHKYRYILKIHSKKSPQRSRGSEWAFDIFNSIVSNNIISEIKISDKVDKFYMAGPYENFVPLNVYYEDNRRNILKILSKAFDRDTGRHIDEHKDQYGFFAGTMFWINVKDLSPLFMKRVHIYDYPKELAQLDGTYAHAMERVFSLVGQIRHKDIYETNGEVFSLVKDVSYRTQDWWDAKASNRRHIDKAQLENVLKSK